MKRKSQSYQALWTALLCFDAGIISAFITKNDYLLLLIPVLFALAIWIALYKKSRYANRIIGLAILILSLYTTMGIILYIAYSNLDFSMSSTGFHILCMAAGVVVYSWNALVFSYKKFWLCLILLSVGMLAVPTIADFFIKLNFVKRLTTYPYLIMIFWQTWLGFIFGLSVRTNDLLIKDEQQNLL